MANAIDNEMEADLKSFMEQLDQCNLKLQDDPNNIQQLELKVQLEEGVQMMKDLIADLEASAPVPEPISSTLPSKEEKWSKEKHPAFQNGFKRTIDQIEETEAPIVYKVNDKVSAKWVSGDKAFYPARIISITGSSAAPVYNVRFEGYDVSETLRGNDLKPTFSDSKKRKADGTPAITSGLVTVPKNPNVISAAADINPDLASQARKDAHDGGDGAPRPKRRAHTGKTKKDLEASKSKWNTFQNSAKMVKQTTRNSQFRTGEGLDARVGVTNSGKPMRKDPTRTRNVYNPVDEDGA